MNVDDYLKNCKVSIWNETFAVIKSKRVYSEAFVNIKDKNEITVIIDQEKYNEEDAIEIEKGWKVLTFNMILPFELTKFLSKISQSLASENISPLVISAYSTDHILVKEKDLHKAKEKLEHLGCVF